MNILEKYQTQGTFLFQSGERLTPNCKDIPNEPGVYLIFTVKDEKKVLAYIIASGKMNQDGSVKIQKLKKRIQNMQNSTTRRQTHFENEIEKLGFDSIEVNWYVTYINEHKDLPLNIEGTPLQQANIKAMLDTEELSEHEVVNIAVGDPTNLVELWEAIAAAAGTDVQPVFGPPRAGDIPHSLASIEKAKGLYGYDPQFRLREGIKITFDWFKKTYTNPYN